MITAIIILSAVAFVSALIATIIHQKAQAYKDCYREEAALSALSPRSTGRAERPQQAQSTRLRKATTVRRKAGHAYAHHVCLER